MEAFSLFPDDSNLYHVGQNPKQLMNQYGMLNHRLQKQAQNQCLFDSRPPCLLSPLPIPSMCVGFFWSALIGLKILTPIEVSFWHESLARKANQPGKVPSQERRHIANLTFSLSLLSNIFLFPPNPDSHFPCLLWFSIWLKECNAGC